MFSQNVVSGFINIFVHWKTHNMEQYTILCSSCLQKSIQGTTMTSLVISH